MTAELEQKAKEALAENEWYESCPASTDDVDTLTKKKLTKTQLEARAAEIAPQFPGAEVKVVADGKRHVLRIRSKSPKHLRRAKVVTV